jgi:hypothetical protein
MPAPLLPKALYYSGDFDAAEPVSVPVFDQPFQGQNISYTFKQDFMQNAQTFATTALGTAHLNFPDFGLVHESECQDAGGGILRWTRTYAKLPETYNDWQSLTYTFIGFSGFLYAVIGSTVDVAPGVPYGREPFQWTVPCRVQKDFFQADTAEEIEIINKMDYVFLEPNVPAKYLTDGPPDGPYQVGSTPSRTQYYAWKIKAAKDKNAGKPWQGTVALYGYDASGLPEITDDENSSQFAAEDSRISRWIGNIWMRETLFVLAQ